MGNIQVILKKEDVQPDKWTSDSVAIIFDVLLATSTITSVLAHGAKDVIPVLNEGEANKKAKEQTDSNYLLAGEMNGVTINDFQPPNPLWLNELVLNKRLILSTTNGTVAIRKSEGAPSIYMASLLNLEAVANWLEQHHSNQQLVLICSGSAGTFSLEDFYGAGGLVHTLMMKGCWDLSDSARAASLLFQNYHDTAFSLFQQSRVGRMMLEYDLEYDLHHVSRTSVYQVVPAFQDGIIKEVRSYESSK